MFENLPQQQQTEQAMVQQGGYPQGYDPYALPIDPYIQNRPPSNIDIHVVMALLDSKLKTGAELDEYKPLLVILMDNVGRIPSADRATINRMTRDMADIIELIACEGTRQRVLDMMTQLLFEIRAEVSYGGAALSGLTGVSAIITQRQQHEQQIRIPTQTPAERKKIFGLI